MNGSFGGDLTSTVEGSEITYQCDDGLTPEGIMTAVCGEDGEWRPNPGDVECRKNDTLSTGITIWHTLVCLYVSWLCQGIYIHSKLSMTFWKHKNNILVSALVYHPLSNEETIQ